MLKWISLLLVLPVLVIGSIFTLPAQEPYRLPAPQTVPVKLLNPSAQTKLASQFLRSYQQQAIQTGRPKDDTYYLRFFSYYPLYRIWSQERVAAFKKLFYGWLAHLTFDAAFATNLPKPVPGSNGTLEWFDTRDYRWNAKAFKAVANREPFFQEPWVNPSVAQEFRELALVYVPHDLSEKDVYPLGAIVNADWLLRETMETDRSTSYYDLLYANQRFIVDDYGNLIKQTDFPANEKDWQKAFGIDVVKAFAAKTRINIEAGAIVQGGRDDPFAGSIVALNNRLIETEYGPIGLTLKTFDVKRTSGARDYLENLGGPEVGHRPLDLAHVVADAFEELGYLPDGAQAGILFAVDEENNTKRIEKADPHVANDTGDRKANGEVNLNSGVGVYGSCAICHAPSAGFIPPKDIFRAEGLDVGIYRRVRDRDDLNRIRAFFTSLDKRIRAAQEPYAEIIRLTTRNQLDPNDQGWTPARWAQELLAFRNWYDGMVGPELAAAYLGVDQGTLKHLAAYSIKVAPGLRAYQPRHRPLMLLQGRPIPRNAFDDDVFRELALILDASRK